MPFSQTQFFDLFQRYNETLGPVLLMLWVASLTATALLVSGRIKGHTMMWLLAVHWGWSAVAYHASFFTRINPAAWAFAGLFAVQALLLLRFSVGSQALRWESPRGSRQFVGLVFLIYGLAYPGLTTLAGHVYPRAPAFGVPCPTTLWTTGALLAAIPPVPWSLVVIPVIWSLIGGSAAWLFGVMPDLALFGAALALAVVMIHDTVRRRQARDGRPA